MELCPLCVMILFIPLIRVGKAQVLTVQPNSPQIFSGETVTLTCTISGWSGPYNWYRDGVYVYSSYENVYTLNIYQSQKYRCFGSTNGQSTTQSNEVTLSVIAKPRPTVSVSSQSPVYTGDRVTLSCNLKSTGWTFHWYKDRRYLSQVDTQNNTLHDTVSNAGVTKYYCKARRGNYESEISDSVTVTVRALPKPVVSIKPDKQVYRGETVTLRCEIQDEVNSHWSYSWNKDGAGVSSEQEYRISGVEMTHTGKYTCRGRERGGSHSTHTSDVTLTVSENPKPELTSDREGAVLTGNSVTLSCTLKLQSAGWKFYWIKHTQSPETETETHSYTIRPVSVSDGGQYWCRAGRGNPVYYTQYSDALWVNVTESLKPVVTIKPDNHVFRGETVTLRCEIQGGRDNEWTYDWYKNKYTQYIDPITQEFRLRSVRNYDSGKYTCRGRRNSDFQRSEISDAVTLTVSDAEAVVSVSPLSWLTEGDSVTLSCEVKHSSTGWTFSWYTDVPYRDSQGSLRYRTELLSDSSRGSGGSYTLSPVTVNHTGVYKCRAERGEAVFHTQYSKPQPLWITVESPPVSLIISPSRSQHFTDDSLSLSCEDLRDSTGWTVRGYTHTEAWSECSSISGSTCNISSLSTSLTGVYWCQSESGGRSNPLNITVHNGDVILDSPVHPVTEGRPLTLYCLYKNTKISAADFYKDDSFLQSQTTGEMTISSVSKSDKGFYHCKHPERGESLKSWVSVRVSASGSIGVITGLSLAFVFGILLIVPTLLLLYKKKKDDETIYANAAMGNTVNSAAGASNTIYSQAVSRKKKQNDDGVSGPGDVIYSQIEMKSLKPRSEDDSAQNNVVYAKIKCKNVRLKDAATEPSDVPYAEINVRKQKKPNRKQDVSAVGKTNERENTVYSELKQKSDNVEFSETVDATYAQVLKKGKRNNAGS